MMQTKTIDAIRFLEEDNQSLRGLFEELEGTIERGTRKRLEILGRLRRLEILGRLGTAIWAHAKVEDGIFYPAYREASRTRDDTLKFFEAQRAHALADAVLLELEETVPTSETFDAKARVLKDLIEHHAEAEALEMLPRARELLGKERLADLGTEMAARHEAPLVGNFAPSRKARAQS